MRWFASGTIVLAGALALAPPARAGDPGPDDHGPAGYGVTGTHSDPVLITQRPPLPPTPSRFPWAYRLTHPGEDVHYYDCYAHHLSDYNCGSFCAEARFIFGSCRVWWNEPCTADKPPVWLPDGTPVWLGPNGFSPVPLNGKGGHGAGGAGRAGCTGCGNW